MGLDDLDGVKNSRGKPLPGGGADGATDRARLLAEMREFFSKHKEKPDSQRTVRTALTAALEPISPGFLRLPPLSDSNYQDSARKYLGLEPPANPAETMLVMHPRLRSQKQIDALEGNSAITLYGNKEVGRGIVEYEKLPSSKPFLGRPEWVVHIAAGKGNNSFVDEAHSFGSGVLVSNDGFVATAGHVTEGRDKITVTTLDGEKFPAQLVHHDFNSDFAMLKLSGVPEGRSFSYPEFGDSLTLARNSRVGVVGHSLGLPELIAVPGKFMTRAQVQAFGEEYASRTYPNDKLFLVCDTCTGGISGGGIFDRARRLIGIINSPYKHPDLLGIKVPRILGFGTSIEEIAVTLAKLR